MDVLIILLWLSGSPEGITIILDEGYGDYQIYIYIAKLAAILEEKQPWIIKALIGSPGR